MRVNRREAWARVLRAGAGVVAVPLAAGSLVSAPAVGPPGALPAVVAPAVAQPPALPPGRAPRVTSAGDPYFPVAPQRVVDTRCAASPAPSFCAAEKLPVANAGLTTLSASALMAWSSPDTLALGDDLSSMSCPSARFCMAMYFDNEVFTWNGSTWSSAISVNDPNGQGLVAVGCTSSTSCVTVDNKGDTLTWNGSTWSVPQSIDPNGDGFADLSCPAPDDCVALDKDGNVLTWNGSTWTAPKSVDTAGLAISISCPSTAFCMMSDAGGHVASWNGSTWTAPVLVDPNAGTLYASCASASFCAAVDDYGRALTWNGAKWSSPQAIDPQTGFDDVSCPSAAFCVAGDGLSRTATWNGSTWSSPKAIDPNSGGIDSVSCPSSAFCAAGDFTGHALVLHAAQMHTTITAQVSGFDGVLSGELDAVLDVTAVQPSAPGYLTVYPAGASKPAASDVNFPAGDTVANLVEVALSASGRIDVTDGAASGTVNVLVDLEGYVAPGTSGAPGDAFTPTAPQRIADTRCFNPSFTAADTTYCAAVPNAVVPAGQVPAKTSVTITVPAGLSGAVAVVANLTVADATAPGYLTVYPAGSSPPDVSNLNFSAGAAIANRFEVPLSSGAFSVYNGSAAPVDVIVDVNGTYTSGTGSAYSGVTPERIVDTRCGAQPPPPFCAGENLPAANAALVTVGPGKTITVQVSGAAGFPAGATAIVANLTAVAASRTGYLTVYPDGTSRPVVSDVNFRSGVPAVANMTVADLGPDDALKVYNGSSGSIDVLVDVAGFYSG